MLVSSVYATITLTNMLFVRRITVVCVTVTVLKFFTTKNTLRANLTIIRLFGPKPGKEGANVCCAFVNTTDCLVPMITTRLAGSSNRTDTMCDLVVVLLMFTVLTVLDSLCLMTRRGGVFKGDTLWPMV